VLITGATPVPVIVNVPSDVIVPVAYAVTVQELAPRAVGA
jgi:hypothetical protein